MLGEGLKRTLKNTVDWVIPGLALTLCLPAFLANLQQWPMTDEANYLLEARKMADGLLPYRDFFEFVTPLGQALGALFFKVNGFSILGLRLLIVFGWLVELILIHEMGKAHLSKRWMILLLLFLGFTNLRYLVFQHHFISGLMALIAVFFAWRFLQAVYAGIPKLQQCPALWGSAFFTAACIWTTQSLGLLLTFALGVFSWLHAYLHEREERDIPYSQVKTQWVAKRWLKTWGLHWGLPFLILNGMGLALLSALGMLPDFMRDAVGWLSAGNYQHTTLIGYFSTFQHEFLDTVKPLIYGIPMPAQIPFWSRIPIAIHLFLIGMLPVIGIVGLGYRLPGRFVYRLLQKPDEEQLLFWLAAVACMLSTFSYSTSMHIVSNGALAYLVGILALAQWLPAACFQAVYRSALGLGLLLGAGYCISGGMQLALGYWLPPFKACQESLLYTATNAPPEAFLTLVKALDEANAENKPIFIMGQSPGLYLPNHYRQVSRFTLIIPIYTSPKQTQEILHALEKEPPLYIVDDQTTRTIHQDPRFAGYTPSQLALPAISNYLQQHYQLKATLGRYLLYERSEHFK